MNLKVLNVFLKEKFSILIDFERANDALNKQSCFFISEKFSMNALTARSFKDYIRIDIFDQVVEINSIPVNEFINGINSTGIDVQEINIKLVVDKDFKLFKLKQKWRGILEETNYCLEEMVTYY